MLHRVILTAASVVALATAANAADMYRPSAGGYKDVPYVGVNWSGVYVGVNGGYGMNSNNSDMNGGFGGGQIGYNVQRGNLVFGVEGDIEGSSIKGPNTGETTPLTISVRFAPVLALLLIALCFTLPAAMAPATAPPRCVAAIASML